MSDRKVGDVVLVLSDMQMRQILSFHLRKSEAWDELEKVNRMEMKLFEELAREYNYEDWQCSINNSTGEIILNRQKTSDEIAVDAKEYKLISGDTAGGQ